MTEEEMVTDVAENGGEYRYIEDHGKIRDVERING